MEANATERTKITRKTSYIQRKMEILVITVNRNSSSVGKMFSETEIHRRSVKRSYNGKLYFISFLISDTEIEDTEEKPSSKLKRQRTHELSVVDDMDIDVSRPTLKKLRSRTVSMVSSHHSLPLNISESLEKFTNHLHENTLTANIRIQYMYLYNKNFFE